MAPSKRSPLRVKIAYAQTLMRTEVHVEEGYPALPVFGARGGLTGILSPKLDHNIV